MLELRRLSTIGLLCIASAAAGQDSELPCGSPPNESVCLGEIDVPDAHRSTFNQAARLAVNGLHSEEFERELAAFIRDHAASGPHSGRWASVEAGPIVARLRQGVKGQDIITYGGLIARMNYRVNGNLAYDGAETGPIKVNREALPRPAEEIANTIAHEVAHRIGLKHRRRGRSEPARCEPPYVIGSLIEKWASAGRWRRRSGDDCHLLPEA